jgi:uncharacterized protein YjdB
MRVASNDQHKAGLKKFLFLRSLALGFVALSCASDRVVGPSSQPSAISEPTAASAAETYTASYSESFTGTSGPLGSPWTQQDPPATINRNGSGVGKGSTNGTDIFVIWTGNTFGNDQYSQVRIAGGLANYSQAVQLSVRSTGTSEATYKGYAFFTDGLSGTGHSEVDKVVNGQWTTLRAFAQSFTTGDVVKLEAVGTAITVYKNGVSLGSVSDATFSSGSPGVGVYGNAVLIDDWQGGSTMVGPVPVAAVVVSPASASVVVGNTQQLTATTKDASNNILTGRSITWSSASPTIASVDPSGLIAAIAPGTATITATSEGQSGTSAVTVVAAQVPVATVAVTPASPVVVAGSTAQLTATATDANANVLTGRSVVWSSSAPTIATVDANTGLVSGIAAGTATITATSEGQSGTAVITVTPPPVATVTVSPATATIVIGASQQLFAATKDAKGVALTGRAVSWSSDKPVATVDANGLVTGVSAGTATITATSEGKTGSSVITITPVPVAAVAVNPSSASVVAGNTVQLAATLTDADGNVLSGRFTVWTSANSSIASVDANGLVTGVAAGGPVAITATSEGKKGTASLTVTPAPVASVSVTPQSTTIAVGGSQALTAVLKDARSNTLTGRTIVWSSDAPAIVAVNGTGVVTGVVAGAATITATSEGQTGSAVVTVAAAPSGIGPLRVSSRNPRYFETPAGQIVYLTGSHTWSNLQDNGTTDPPPVFNYQAYLDFLVAHGHNFFRLYAWEQQKWTAEISADYWFSGGPYSRPGPGLALDGKPKFDLTQFDQSYFDRVRQRVIDAGARGIYVSVMLFNGWSITTKPGSAYNNPWKGHPFNAANNINGINGDANGDGLGTEVQTLNNATITSIQDAYVRRVVDAVSDLPNVLYEIDNEGDVTSKGWQYHIIQVIRDYESTKGSRHPIGITAMWPNGVDSDLYGSAADWVSPAGNIDNPVSATGSKVLIGDTDHFCGICGNVAWVWRSLTRGQNPILMDGYDGAAVGVGALDYSASNPVWEAIRKNLGYARNIAIRMNLAAAVPRGDLASTGYCLAVVGSEYVVFLPGGGSTNVNLSGVTGARTVEWFNPGTGQTVVTGSVNASSTTRFTAPFSGAAVLYIHR